MTSIIRSYLPSSVVSSLLGGVIFVTLICEARVLTMITSSPPGSFVQTRGTEFEFNGSSFLFNGFNSYWMMNVAVDPTQRYKVSNVFREASAAGLTVGRTWAFSDGGDQALQVSPGVYNENVFQALDFVVAEAEKYGIKLILSLVNNYNDFGGRAQYVEWAKNASVAVSNDDDFYTNPVIKDYYKNHVRSVLTRMNTITRTAYQDEATIMAWELINEPRCQVDYSGKTLTAWVEEMSAYVKSIDNNHLLEVGMEGFYGDSIPDRKQYNPGFQVGTDFITSNLIKDIDFATIHAYPDNWLGDESEEVQEGFMQKWMTSHWEDSERTLKKPLVLSEFGKSKKDKGYSINARDSYMNFVYSSMNNLAENGTFSGAMVWQLLDEGMDSYDDGYEIVLSKDTSTKSIITHQSSQIASLQHSYIYSASYK